MASTAQSVEIGPLPVDQANAAAALAQAEGLISVEAAWLEAHCRAFPHLCLAAWREGQLVGLSVASDFRTYAFLGPLAVVGSEHGKGIGGLLLERTISSLRGTSILALEATDAGRRLYERREFVAKWPTVRMRAEAPTPSTGPVPGVAGDLDELLRIDKACTGGDRSDALRLTASLYGLEPFTYGSAAALAGNGRIGPLIGGSIADVEVVLDAACNAAGGPIACWTRGLSEVMAVLERRGFALVEAAPRLVRMARGGAEPVDPATLFVLLSLQAG
jgi:GNAT superfamily N-acetyltransferase